MQNNHPDDDYNKRLEQELLGTEDVQRDQDSVPAPKQSIEQY